MGISDELRFRLLELQGIDVHDKLIGLDELNHISDIWKSTHDLEIWG